MRINTHKNNLRGDKVPIMEAQDPIFPNKRFDTGVHVHKEGHLKGNEKQVHLLYCDIHQWILCPNFC